LGAAFSIAGNSSSFPTLASHKANFSPVAEDLKPVIQGLLSHWLSSSVVTRAKSSASEAADVFRNREFTDLSRLFLKETRLLLKETRSIM
jgi:hypothetical protein